MKPFQRSGLPTEVFPREQLQELLSLPSISTHKSKLISDIALRIAVNSSSLPGETLFVECLLLRELPKASLPLILLDASMIEVGSSGLQRSFQAPANCAYVSSPVQEACRPAYPNLQP